MRKLAIIFQIHIYLEVLLTVARESQREIMICFCVFGMKLSMEKLDLVLKAKNNFLKVKNCLYHIIKGDHLEDGLEIESML